LLTDIFKMKKRGQIWYSDFVIGTMIFLVMIAVFYKYSANIQYQDKGLTNGLLTDAKLISSSLLDPGTPSNWTADNVARIGLTNGNHDLNESKISVFYNMPYNSTKKLFGSRYDYYVYFENRTRGIVNINGSCGFGSIEVQAVKTGEKCENISLASIDIEKLLKMTRIVSYRNDLNRMVIYTWLE